MILTLFSLLSFLRSFSKQSLLNSARAIQAENEQKYALTDSATILEVALNRIKMRGERDSFLLSSSTKTAKTDLTADEDDYQGAMMVRTESQDFDCDAEQEEGSLGNPSYDDADDEQLDNAVQYGEPLANETEAWTPRGNSGGGSGHHIPSQSPSFHGDANSAQESASGVRRDSFELEEEFSLGNGTANDILDHSQLSPVAPAPSHLDASVFSDGSHVDAHLHAALHSPLHRAGTKRTASPPPVLSSTLEKGVAGLK